LKPNFLQTIISSSIMRRYYCKADQSQSYSRRRNRLQKTYDNLPQQSQLNQPTHFSNNILAYAHTEKYRQTLPQRDTKFNRHTVIEDNCYDRSDDYFDIVMHSDDAMVEDVSNNEYFYENERIDSDGDESKVVEEPLDTFEECSGQYGPYFPNFTAAMFFTWVTKHMISTAAYNDLVTILRHPEFNPSDIVGNIRRLRQWRTRLPLPKIYSHDIAIKPKDTPSTSVLTKPAYMVSVKDIIQKCLDNPKIYSKMYFGSGVEKSKKSEFWHGEIWKESPFFGKNMLKINRSVYHSGECIYYQKEGSRNLARIRAIIKTEAGEECLKVDRLLTYEKLPKRFYSAERECNQATSQWLLEGFPVIVQQHEVVAHAAVWFKDSTTPIEYDYEVGEIIYKIYNSWKIRSISQRHQLPAEYIPQIVTLPEFPVLKLFIDLYADEFGAYQLSNTVSLCQQSMDSFDLPQGNDFARVKRHGANHGCRTCMADQTHLTDSKYDYIANARFNQETEQKIEQLEDLSTSLARERWSTEHGLMLKPGPLDTLIWDRHKQTPQDAYHSMAGKTLKLLDVTMNLFSNGGQEQWLYHWKRIEKPTKWSALPNPLTHLHSFSFSDVLNIAMLVPFILRRFLAPAHLKSHIRCELKRRLGLQRDSHVINNIIKCWVIVAKSLKMVFSSCFTELDYDALQSTLNEEREILVEMFPDTFKNLPN
ncbi:8055_t:CDS:2, partial [Paraglomus occultum]